MHISNKISYNWLKCPTSLTNVPWYLCTERRLCSSWSPLPKHGLDDEKRYITAKTYFVCLSSNNILSDLENPNAIATRQIGCVSSRLFDCLLYMYKYIFALPLSLVHSEQTASLSFGIAICFTCLFCWITLRIIPWCTFNNEQSEYFIAKKKYYTSIDPIDPHGIVFIPEHFWYLWLYWRISL